MVRLISKKICDRERLVRELEVLRPLEHPNLARLCQVVEDGRFLWLAFEQVQGSDLFSAVAAAPKLLTEACVAHALRQVLLGLQHLHGAGLAHEAVQPHNILTSRSSTGQELRLKLIDYGFAWKYSKAAPVLSMQHLHCVAPEQVGSLSPRTSLADPACDLWAVGALAFALLSGRWPLEAECPAHLRKKLRTGLWAFLPADIWNPVRDVGKSFINSTLIVQAFRRPSASQALQHAFFAVEGLDKAALQPLPRNKEVALNLRRLAGRHLMRYEVASAAAVVHNEARIKDLGEYLQDLDPMRKGDLTFVELRRGLVRASLELPGRLLDVACASHEDGARVYPARDICDAAAQRRRLLEEIGLWSVWSAVVPDVFSLKRSEVHQLWDRGASTLRCVFSPLWDLDMKKVEELPELVVTFKDMLEWLRSCAARAAPELSLHEGSRMLQQELLLRLPPATD